MNYQSNGGLELATDEVVLASSDRLGNILNSQSLKDSRREGILDRIKNLNCCFQEKSTIQILPQEISLE